MHVREAVPDDIETIFRFVQELADYERLGHEVVGDTKALREHLFGADPVCEVLIGEVDGEPAGFALFFRKYSTFQTAAYLHLEDLFVRPEHRGRGLGKALLDRLAAISRERGCPHLEWNVLDWNESAIGFYEKLGAELLTDWRTYRLSGAALELGEEATS